MKKTNNKKAFYILTFISLIIILVIGSILAYLTDSEGADNVFTIGKVSIELIEKVAGTAGESDEEFWNSTTSSVTGTDALGNTVTKDGIEELSMGQVIPKQPYIKNTGKNNAWVYMSVAVPVVDSDGTQTELFSYTINPGWTAKGWSYRTIDGIDYIFYKYQYDTELVPNAITSTLFDNVKFVEDLDITPESLNSIGDLHTIKVKAYAIQSNNVTIAQGYGEFFSFKVNFNANGGVFQEYENSSETTIVAIGESDESLPVSTRDGYTLAGWNTKSNGSGTTCTNMEQISNLKMTNGEALNLYAIWNHNVKYAVQIYGINQDVDASGNTLGLTFGPAVGANYNNRYVTHEYEETSEGSGEYYVKIITHTVAGNGSETTSSAYLTDSSSNNVTRNAAQVTARENISLHDMTWTEIEAVSDKTVFEDCMLCGDTKSVILALNSTLSSGSIYNQYGNQYGDGAGMLKNTIKNTTGAYYRNWNPNKTQNAYVETAGLLTSSELSYGSNAKNAGGYSVSHIRATLIGKNAKTNEGYAGDVNLTSDTCLYSCIESDLQAVITPKKIKYVTGTGTNSYTLNDNIADSIWLFSEREMYGTGQYSGNLAEGLGASGDGYNKFGNTESKYYISSYNTNGNTNRVVYTEAGSSSGWWFRSPSLSGTYDVRGVRSSGYIYSGGPDVDLGLNFGFCIK